MLEAECHAVCRLALAGDAAHVVHPLAGQGLNLGIYDAAALLNAALCSLEVGDDLGSNTTVRRQLLQTTLHRLRWT